MRHLLIALLVLGGMACMSAGAARADGLAADLSSHVIAITTGFTGTEVVLFGATDGKGDVIVVVRAPGRPVVVRRKRHIVGMWINTRSVVFSDAPGFYAVYASAPLEQIAPAAVLAERQIGMANLRLGQVEGVRSPGELADYRAALLAEEQGEHRYAAETGRIEFLGDRLFRADVALPASVPTGAYLVQVLLLRDKAVISDHITPLVVSQIGVSAALSDFAERRALLYGIVAVLGAVAAGWLASLPFRNA
ncbi:MAG TPA: TIGR02186 family protein [Stellaceae bacterium]|nr:TIGR02186 family protein [Stellaceae bacterium]